jgi:D-alanyl-D-alanine carboxypeptidase
MSNWLSFLRLLAVRFTSIFIAGFLAMTALSSGRASQVQAAPLYAAMVVDGRTGNILHSRNGDALRFPASLTKIMTLYLLFDYMEAGKIEAGTLLTITPYATKQSPSKLGLKAGQQIRVSDAIRAMVTKSANDVAVAIAENISGTEANFAKLMTVKALKIGMTRTTFKNASGLPDKAQVTTARDMIILAANLINNHPEKYAYFKQKYFKYKGKKYKNHNKLLFDYEGTDGIKTGYTRISGFNLLANVHRKDKHLIAVVFGGKTSKRRNAAMRLILDKAMPKATSQQARTKMQ